MSAISGFINTIRNAVYGEQVRGAIISALEQCYSDVNAPSLQTAAFTAALNAAYAGGILDIQTVTQISLMTNQNIIYRYNGTETGKNKGLYYYSPITSTWVLLGSEVQEVSLVNQMTDTKAIYKYIGTETGMVQNSLYCHNGTAWLPIGSGVLTASTASLMTNTGAIYKYTGNETGYVTNALYYHNGTSWVPVSFNLPTGGTIGAPLVSDGEGGATWGTAQKGLTDGIINALIACFRAVAWVSADSATLLDDLIYQLTGESHPTEDKTIDFTELSYEEKSIVTNGDTQTYAGWATYTIPVQGYDTVSYEAAAYSDGRIYVYAISFFDSNNNFIIGYGKNESTVIYDGRNVGYRVGGTVSIPSNATNMCVSYAYGAGSGATPIRDYPVVTLKIGA